MSDNWQDISTAPKDGTVMLLHHSIEKLCGYGPAVRPRKAIAVGYFDGHWSTGVPGGHSTGGEDSQFTHWMPLPAPPKGAA
jgi:hypothetical protein